MATLADALRAEDKVDGGESLFSAISRAFSGSRPLDRYGLDEGVTFPRVNLDSSELVAGFRQCCKKADEVEARRNLIIVDEEVGSRLEVLFRYLPDVIRREGWSKDILAASGEALLLISHASYQDSSAPLNLLYHSVLSNLRSLESIPLEISVSMVRMLNRWEDLASVVQLGKKDALRTPYFSSTRGIAEELLPILDAAIQQPAHHADATLQRRLKYARQLLETGNLICALRGKGSGRS
jgi:hypothetical protein